MTAQICTRTINDCLLLGGEYATPSLISNLANCARMCETAVQFMLSSSALHYITCLACAEVCEQVADEAELVGAGMEDFIEACRHSAESCRQMSIHEVKYMPFRDKKSQSNLHPES